MNTFMKLGLCMFLVTATLQTVYSISCYVCNSHNQPNCDSPPVHSKYKVDCRELKDGAKYDRCRKVEQWVDYEQDGMKPDSRVVRSCGWNQTNERGCYYRAGFGGRQRVCTCYIDDCNSASQISLTTFSLITAMFLFVLNWVF